MASSSARGHSEFSQWRLLWVIMIMQPMRPLVPTALLATFALLLSSCAVGPRYHKPEAEIKITSLFRITGSSAILPHHPSPRRARPRAAASVTSSRSLPFRALSWISTSGLARRRTALSRSPAP